MTGPQSNANPIGQQQSVANKIIAWTGVLEWQEVTYINFKLRGGGCNVIFGFVVINVIFNILFFILFF